VTGRRGMANPLMLSTIAMIRGGPAPAVDWSETLDAGTNVAYHTNPALLPGSNIADRSAQLALDGNIQMATEVSQLTVTPRLAVIRYDQEKNLDLTTGSLALSYQDKGERGQWNASGLAQTDSTLTSELGQTGITNVNFRHNGYNATLGYQYLATERLSWSLQGSGQIAQYNSEAQQYGLSPYKYGGIQLGPTWSFSDRLDGSLSIGADRVSPQNSATEKDYSANAQLKRSLTEKYSWRISAGATRVEVPGSTATPTSAVFELGATRQGERVQWDLSAKRAVLPIGLGLLAREDVAALSAVVTVSERSTLNLSCSVIRTDPVSISFYLAPGISLGYQVYSGAAWGQASAEWQYHFSPQWALSAAYTQARARNYSVAEWANGNQGRLGILWQSGRL
jgi:hypothetical protein